MRRLALSASAVTRDAVKEERRASPSFKAVLKRWEERAEERAEKAGSEKAGSEKAGSAGADAVGDAVGVGCVGCVGGPGWRMEAASSGEFALRSDARKDVGSEE